jgi:hypothetical protein
MRAMLMGAVIHCHVHMVVTRGHGTRGHGSHRLVEFTYDERQTPFDGRQHETAGNEAAQEQQAEQDEYRPTGFLELTHATHRRLILQELAQNGTHYRR